MGEKDPAFLFYPKDWLSDPNVMAMTLEQKGAYFSLICICWLQTYIPEDPAQLAAILGVPKGHFEDHIWGNMSHCFKASRKPNSLTHPRVERERTHRRGHKLKMSEAGKKGAAKRWASKGSNSKANAMAIATDNSSSSSSSSSSSRSNPKKASLAQTGFEQFWEVYPRKTAKKDAIKAWRTLKPDADLQELILDAVAKQKYCAQWTRDDGQAIPYPASFIRGERWKDEVDPSMIRTSMTVEEVEARAARGKPDYDTH